MGNSTINRYKNRIIEGFMSFVNLFIINPVYIVSQVDNGGPEPYSNSSSDSFDEALKVMQQNIRRIMIADRDEDLITVLTELVNLAITFIGIIAVVFLIIGGVKYILAGGDESKTEEANKTIINALIGLVIIILSGVIVNFVIKVLA